MPDLCILHTNDMHNRLDEAGAAALGRHRVSQRALLLDAGDAAWAGNVYYRPGGEPILDTMSRAGYDAMTVGNREFHFSAAGFQSKISRASFTCLCANLQATRGDTIPCAPCVIMERGGVRVGVFGLTVPMVRRGTRAASFSAFVFDPPLEAARRTVSDLKAESDLVIALTHIGLAEDRKLARDVAGIDLVIGGHSHDCLTELAYAGDVPIAQAGCYARWYGVIEMTRQRGRWVAAGRLEPLAGGQR